MTFEDPREGIDVFYSHKEKVTCDEEGSAEIGLLPITLGLVCGLTSGVWVDVTADSSLKRLCKSKCVSIHSWWFLNLPKELYAPDRLF